MKLNISKKILGTVLVMALLVFIAAIIGMLSTVEVARIAKPLMQEKIPLKTISMEALLVSEKSLGACKSYLLASSDRTSVTLSLDSACVLPCLPWGRKAPPL